uniref:Uncharacterized protein n=1 Tax=Leptospirillum ferriphilum TaxID=178606 RepID=A0A7C3QW94_9BACT
MEQFGVNQTANLDNPLPGARNAPRSPDDTLPARREIPPRPRPEEVEPQTFADHPDRAPGGERGRLDFYA